jgi:hypothetical protein
MLPEEGEPHEDRDQEDPRQEEAVLPPLSRLRGWGKAGMEGVEDDQGPGPRTKGRKDPMLQEEILPPTGQQEGCDQPG